MLSPWKPGLLTIWESATPNPGALGRKETLGGLTGKCHKACTVAMPSRGMSGCSLTRRGGGPPALLIGCTQQLVASQPLQGLQGFSLGI